MPQDMRLQVFKSVLKVEYSSHRQRQRMSHTDPPTCNTTADLRDLSLRDARRFGRRLVTRC